MPIIELGPMGVKPGFNIMDKNTAEGKILANTYNAIAIAPGGPNRLYYGLEIEDAQRIWAFFEWDSLEHHETFAKEQGWKLVEDLPRILTHGVFTKHIDIHPFPPLALRSPVTQFTMWYFHSDMAKAGKDLAMGQLRKFVENNRAEEWMASNSSVGWGTENDFPIIGLEGQKGAVLTLLVGWENLEEHQEHQKKAIFNEDLKVLRRMEEIIVEKTVLFRLVQGALKCPNT